MPSYTVVIIPDAVDDQRAGGETPRLTVRVEATTQEARVTEIAISATAMTGLTAQSVEAIDMTAIVTALSAKFLPSAPRIESTRIESTKSAAAAPDRIPDVDSQPEHIVRKAVSTPPRRTPVASATTPQAAGEAGRAYRRMPDVDELRAMYENLGTVTAVAKHYGVPRHTAQGWMGRLRKLDQPANST